MGSDLVLSHGTGSTNQAHQGYISFLNPPPNKFYNLWQVWKSDGTAQPASGSPHVVGALQPAPWTCKGLQERAVVRV